VIIIDMTTDRYPNVTVKAYETTEEVREIVRKFLAKKFD